MNTITNKVHDNCLLRLEDYYRPEDIVVFDIETTGFAAETTLLCMIGCSFYQDGNWMITQWFNNDGISEREILLSFMEFIKSYKYIMHYNGDGFDIPYIQKKLAHYMLDYTFDNLESVDLYKHVRQFKNILHLDNLKQKSLERFLGINRLDKYTGGDLIKVYEEYLIKHTDNGKQLLFQHNYEDLEGLMYCCCLLAYKKLKEGAFHVQKMSVKRNRLFFSLSLDYSLPKRITLGINDILITGYETEATINTPIIDEELKFFFDNYKEYYYLPAEDMAVHKSVASYVDKNYRQQAKRDTCYTRRKGFFISQIDSGIIPGYKREFENTETFIELADSFLQDMNLLNAYARHVIEKAFA